MYVRKGHYYQAVNLAVYSPYYTALDYDWLLVTFVKKKEKIESDKNLFLPIKKKMEDEPGNILVFGFFFVSISYTALINLFHILP